MIIGIRTIILPSVNIRNNLIIGAGSVVIKDIPSDVVAGGNPAKVISILNNYYDKRKNFYLNEAFWYAIKFIQRTGKDPEMKDMGDFFPLYFKGELQNLNSLGVYTRCNGDN